MTVQVCWLILRVYDVTAAVKDPEADRSRRVLARNQERLIHELQRNNEELAQVDALRNGLLQMSRAQHDGDDGVGARA